MEKECALLKEQTKNKISPGNKTKEKEWIVMNNLYIDVIECASQVEGHPSTNDLVGILKYNDKDLSFDEINGILDEMHDLGYIKDLGLWSPEKTFLILPKGHSLKFKPKEEPSSSTVNNYFSGSFENSMFASGNSISQKQENSSYKSDVQEIVDVLAPLIGDLLEDSETPESIRQSTSKMQQELDALKQGKSSLERFKGVSRDFLIGLVASASTQPAINLSQAIGQLLVSLG